MRQTVAPSISCAESPDGKALPDAVVDSPYSVTFSADGINGSHSWSLASDPLLPDGLSFDPRTATISGKPDAMAGDVIRVTISVTDSRGATISRPYSLTVHSRLRISGIAGFGANGGIQLEATGGVPRYAWSTAQGTELPVGMRLSPEGVVTAENGTRFVKLTKFTAAVKDSYHGQRNSHEGKFVISMKPSGRRRIFHIGPRNEVPAVQETEASEGIPVRAIPHLDIAVAYLDVKIRPSRRLRLGPFAHTTFWLAALAIWVPLTGGLCIVVYAAKTPGPWGTYLGVGALAAIAAQLTGCLIGFLFGVPKSGDPAKAQQQSGGYRSNSNLSDVSDWLTKLLLGAGLVSLGRLGNPVGRLIDDVANGLHITPAYAGSAKVMAGAIIFGYTALGILEGYTLTTMWYQRKLANLHL
jgi:hypothetical protein